MQTEKNIWLKVLSMIVTLALLISCVPNQVYAMAGEALADLLDTTDTAVLQPNATPDPVLSTAQIVAEDETRRGETYKEYIMNNGLRLATVYPSAIHYEQNGQWKDIDNTLVATVSNGKAVYQNAAGAWNVRFPRNLSGSDMIGITKNGHTVQFGMAGELRSTGDLVVASVDVIGSNETVGTLAVNGAQTTVAEIQQIDMTAAREAAEHPETVLEKLNSRITYANVYPSTNVVYDLQGNRLKESVVLQRYDASLWGYRYTLDTGDLVPVLRDDQQIDLCDPKTNEPILTMPAPYMLDSNGEVSYDVEVTLSRNGSGYLLSYYLPRAWLAETDRGWPVILDPIVDMVGTATKVKDCTVSEKAAESYTNTTLECGHNDTRGVMRFFLQYTDLPTMTSADVIVDATLSLYKPTNGTMDSIIEVHKVNEAWESKTVSWDNMPTYDPVVEDYVPCKLVGRYTWNITDVVRGWYTNENEGILFKASDEIENARNGNWKQFYSSDKGSSEQNGPLLTITFVNSNGLEDYWSYNSSSAGRAGTGYVNLFTGNLTWVRGDLGFDGNRMPVSISHVYNSNDSQANQFGMGYGWRTNYNQTITLSSGVYAWEDGDGTRHYFYPAKDSAGNTIANTYLDEDGLHLTLTTGGSGNQKYQLIDQYGNKSYFDTKGRLCKNENNQQTKSNITITYTTTTGNLINTITDGAGRKYQFHYQSNLLSKVSYKGTGETELTYVLYTYENGDLAKITDKDLKSTTYVYDEDHFLTTVEDVTNYLVKYSYSEEPANNLMKRVNEITEYDKVTEGNWAAIEYDSHYVKVTDHKGTHTYHQFNDWGNLVAIHDSTGRVQYTKYSLNDAHDLISGTAEPHQVIEISNIDGVSNNVLFNGSFEDGEEGDVPSGWSEYGRISSDHAYRGSQSMRISTDYLGYDVTDEIGPQYNIEPGETYTFSAYVWLERNTEIAEPQVYVTFGDNTEQMLVGETDGWTRIQVTYTNEELEIKAVYPKFRVIWGTIYVDCIQIEKAQVASPYNELENGDFLPNNSTDANGWEDGASGSISNYYADVNAANLLLSAGSVGFIGDPSAERYLEQTMELSGTVGDAYVLAGWAIADAAPLSTGREFGLKLIFHNTNGTDTVYYASFDTDISSDHWQYTAVTAVADSIYYAITVQAVYNHQNNMAYFDGLQLTKGRAGTVYTYDENKNVKTETNILGQTTTYAYDDNGVDLIGVDASIGSDVSYVYDSFHNVVKMTETTKDLDEEDHITTYQYEYDNCGNTVSVTVSQTSSDSDDTPLVQKSLTSYTANGNYVTATTDSSGNTTRYGYDEQTGVLLWVQYPKDTVYTRTNYEYDVMYRLVRTYAETDQKDLQNKQIEMSAEYFYQDDLLAVLQTNSTRYRFVYNEFNLRESVNVGNNLLVGYVYTEDKNHYLERLDYANGDRVKYSYDSLGRVIKETYFEDNERDVPSRVIRYSYDSSGAVARVTDSATGIETVCWYDYAGRVAVLAETDNRTFYREVVNTYDANGNVTNVKEILREFGYNVGIIVVEEAIYGYEYVYDYKNRLASVRTNDTIKDYHYDELDRLTSEEVSDKDGQNVLVTRYGYHSAVVDGTSVTTNQVERRTILASRYRKDCIYEYDSNGNIVSIKGDDDIVYVYDSANQLIAEYNESAGWIWQWTYDDAGNITSKTEINLEIGERADYYYDYDQTWGDLLTFYDGRIFSYDANGNLTDDGIWEYTWQQGRQLATMSNGSTTWTYTYDANGMRIGRSNGTKTYSYLYTNGLLSRMILGDDTLCFAYDAVGAPLTVNYNGTTFYYVTNLQGDVIAILDRTGYPVVQYTYNAWGELLSATGPMLSSLGALNPLLYRGYVYDRETGLYYLQSRYYNPEIGRFISADTYVSTGQGILGNNMFAYCNNNPIMFADPTGECLLTAIIIGAIAGAVIGGAIGGTVAYNSAKSSGLEGSDLFWATASGVGKGALIGSALGSLAGATGGVLATYELGSVAATAMITATANITARAFEVTALQTKKSLNDGDNGWQVANDCISSLFSNGLNIMSPALKKTGATIGTYFFVDITKHRVIPLGFKSFLESTGGKALGYGFAALAWVDAINSMKSANPIARAEKRGFVLT